MQVPFDPASLASTIQALAAKQHRDAALLAALRAAGVAPPASLAPVEKAVKAAGVAPWPPLIPLTGAPKQEPLQPPQVPASQRPSLPVSLDYSQRASSPPIGFDMGAFAPNAPSTKPPMANPAEDDALHLAYGLLRGEAASRDSELASLLERLRQNEAEAEEARKRLKSLLEKPAPERPKRPKGPSTKEIGAAAMLAILARLLGDERWDFLKGMIGGYQQGQEMRRQDELAEYEDAEKRRQEEIKTAATLADAESGDVADLVRRAEAARAGRSAAANALAGLENARMMREARADDRELRRQQIGQNAMSNMEQVVNAYVAQGNVEGAARAIDGMRQTAERYGIDFNDEAAKSWIDLARQNRMLQSAEQNYALGSKMIQAGTVQSRAAGIRYLRMAQQQFKAAGDPRAGVIEGEIAAIGGEVRQLTTKERAELIRAQTAMQKAGQRYAQTRKPDDWSKYMTQARIYVSMIENGAARNFVDVDEHMSMLGIDKRTYYAARSILEKTFGGMAKRSPSQEQPAPSNERTIDAGGKKIRVLER